MANRSKAKRDKRTAGRGQTAEAQPGSRPATPGPWAILYLAIALGIVAAAMVVIAPDDSRQEPSDPPAAPKPLVEEAGFFIPSTPAEATVEELKEEARQAADDLLGRFPQSAEAHHVKALLEKALRQTDDAQKSWRTCIALAPDHARARVGLARVLIDQGDDEAAARALGEALAAGCSSAEVYSTLATSFLHLGRFDAAVEVLDKGLAAFPRSPKCRLLHGQAQIQRGELQQAELSLRKAIELSPEYTDAHYALATVCARRGKREEAAKCRKRFGELKAHDRELEDRLALVPDLDMMRQRAAATLCAAGTVCLRQGDRSEAERLLLRAMAIAPRFPESCRGLASLYQSQGKIAEAVVVQYYLVEIEPDNVVNYVNLANLCSRLGAMAEAEKVLQQAVDACPETVVAQAYLAQLYLKTGKPDQARSLAQEVVHREPTATGYRLLASACRQLGDTSGVEAALEEARKLESNDAQHEQVEPSKPQAK